MLLCGKVASTEVEAVQAIEKALDSGTALARFRGMVTAQGGDPRVVDEPRGVLPMAKRRSPVVAAHSGFVMELDAYDVGVACLHLGGGRRSAADRIDPGVGIELVAQVGDKVEEGQPLAFLHENGNGVDSATQLLAGAYHLGSESVVRGTRILEVLR
jgi:pyrimidine-nucleoside phosphorylase